MQHLSRWHLSISGISQFLLTWFWWNFKGIFIGTSKTDSNCHGDICPGNICPGSIFLVTFVHIRSISDVTDTIWTKLLRQGQGKVRARSRQGQCKVNARSRQSIARLSVSVSTPFDESRWVSVSTSSKFLSLDESWSRHPPNFLVSICLGLDILQILKSRWVLVSTS